MHAVSKFSSGKVLAGASSVVAIRAVMAIKGNNAGGCGTVGEDVMKTKGPYRSQQEGDVVGVAL
jgi:hypothetical protein